MMRSLLKSFVMEKRHICHTHWIPQLLMTWCCKEPGQQQPWYWHSSPGTWWCHQMETFSALLSICAGNSPVPSEFPTQRGVTWSFDVYFDLRPNKWLSKQSWGWWFETASCPLWCHRNDHPVSASEGLAHPPWTKWLPFHRHPFQMQFRQWKFFHFDSNVTEVCSWGSNWQKVSIGSGNGLAPNRWQAITWTNVDSVHPRIDVALGGDELVHWGLVIFLSKKSHHWFR